jgi:aspartate kinase
MVVQKFGGTSVADADAIARLIAIVRDAVRGAHARDGRGPAVVVSAMSGVTDALIALANDAASGRASDAIARLRDVQRRHEEAARRLAPDDRGVVEEIGREIRQIESVIGALAVLRDVSPRSLDLIVATGELLSSRLVVAALQHAGVTAAWVDPRVVVITNDEHSRAVPRMAETRAAMRSRVVPILDAGQVPVIGGFVGATVDGQTTTLGRGGSDYSGALVGDGIDAKEIQIWTDVDGMLTADPRVVEAPRLVPQLSFAEAAELAYFGAKVLHPSTILPAVERDIPVRILNSRRAEGTGTRITAAGGTTGAAVTALACKREVTVIDVTSSRMLMAYGFLRRVFEVFERFRTAVDVVTTSEVSVSVTIDDTRELEAIRRELEALGEVRVESGMALLCAVGDRLREAPEAGAQVVAILEEVPLRMISQAASRRNITVVLRQEDLPRAMRRLHEELFG